MNKRDTPYMNDDRASIGIGAMIVFIALILVAAVASTIIIKTAEELQQRAEATGDDTRDEISGKVTIISAHIDTVAAHLWFRLHVFLLHTGALIHMFF